MSWDRYDAAIVLVDGGLDATAWARAQPFIAALTRHLPVVAVLPAGLNVTADHDADRLCVIPAASQSTDVGSADLARMMRERQVIRPMVIAIGEKSADAALSVFAPLRIALDPTEDGRVARAISGRAGRSVDLLLASETCPADAAPAGLAERMIRGNTDAWMSGVENADRRSPTPHTRYDVLVLYDAHSVHVGTIRDHLESFATHSRHRFWYAHAANDTGCAYDPAWFDAVVIHYSCRVCYSHMLSAQTFAAVERYAGLKVLFIQDEYDSTHSTHSAIDRLGVQVVMTCVPRESIQRVYAPERFPHVRFVETLTGYVSEAMEDVRRTRPVSQREWIIGYRGRTLGYWYGELAREKVTIGVRMREICRERGIPADIEVDEHRRLYGNSWHEFLGNCRATLGTESGANLFDWDGTIKETILTAMMREPELTFEDAYERYLQPHDHAVRMNQVSPRIFEAIALRTALVLFEGEYSGVVQPNVHYLPLKKDFSNVDDVLNKLHDDALIEQMTNRAHEDVIASGRYSYRAFTDVFDELLEDELGCGADRRLVPTVVGSSRGRWAQSTIETVESPKALKVFAGERPAQLHALEPLFASQTPRSMHAIRLFARRVVPEPVRRRLKPPLRFLALRVLSLLRRRNLR